MKSCQHQKTKRSGGGPNPPWVSIETVTCLDCGEELERWEIQYGYSPRELPIQKKEVKQDGNQTQ